MVSEKKKKERKVYAGHRPHAIRKGPLTSKLARAPPEVPQNYTSYSWFQSSLSSSGKVETFVKDHNQIFKRINVGQVFTIIQQLGKTISPGIEAYDLIFLYIDMRARSSALSIRETRKFGKPQAVTAPVSPSVIQPM
eukprot:1139931-Pelagomonas_calceolata.AAC.1